MNKYIIALALLVLPATLYANHGGFKIESWQYKRPISAPEGVQGYVRAKLDADVYAKSPNLQDLRVLDENNEEIPYQLVEQQARLSSNYYPSTILDSSVRNGQRMFIIDLGSSGVIHSRLNIQTSSYNYKKKVYVYASNERLDHDDSSWRLISSSNTIYNFNDPQLGFNATSGDVQYPKSSARYLRVVIGEGQGGPVNVPSVQVYKYEVTGAEEETMTVPVKVDQNVDAKSTEITADLGASGIPTHTIILSSSDKNFDRRAVVQGSNDGKNWTLLSQAYIFNVNTALFTGSQLTLTYPEARTRYVRVVVFNEDNRPLTFSSSVSMRGIVRNVIFEALPNHTYSLYYGNPSVAAPRYDLARLFKYIESENLPGAELRAAEVNTFYVAPPPPVIPFTERFPYLLNIALVILVAIIGVFIVVYVRKQRV